MPLKTVVTYSPQNVAKGLRDLIAWETRHRASVEIRDLGLGGYEAHVTLATRAIEDDKKVQLEANLKGILPGGYTLKMTWN